MLLEALVPQTAEPGPPRKKGHKKHGPRGSRPNVAEILTFKSSGKPQLSAALRMSQSGKADDTAGRRQVAALCCQEHHAAGEDWVDI